nr:mucin-19-like isoform X1 [Penaeus vannamei]
MAAPPPSPEHTPPPSPSASPSSSDEVTSRAMPSSSPGSQSPSSTSAFSPAEASAPSPSAAASTEPTSTTLSNSFNLPMASSRGAEGDAEDASPSSSKAGLDSPPYAEMSSSSTQAAFEVSSSNLGLDAPSFCDIPHNSTPGASGTSGPCPADSSEAAFVPRHSRRGSGTPPSSSRWSLESSSVTSESFVSRSSWSPAGLHMEAAAVEQNVSSQWSSQSRNGYPETEVSSTGPPECAKAASDSFPEWPSRHACSGQAEPAASTSSWPHDPVNSTDDEGAARASWGQGGASHASGSASCVWRCDSQNSVAETSTSAPAWCHPSSTSAALPTSSQHHAPGPANTSAADNSSHALTWRSRAASAPLSLTRVTPTAPPPRPPTPPRPSTPPTTRHRAHVPSPTAPRRSLSPSRLSARARRSVSPPLHHHARAQPPTPPRRSVSPVSLQPGHAQPPSPTVRSRLSPRPRHLELFAYPQVSPDPQPASPLPRPLRLSRRPHPQPPSTRRARTSPR